MRLEVSVDIVGSDLTGGDTGMGEVDRLLVQATDTLWAGAVLQPGDAAPLHDSNGVEVGHVRLVPDWTVGEEVWVTNEVGSLLKSVVYSVRASVTSPGYWAVTTRFIASHELMPGVLVDAWGHDHHGRPVLGRVR